MNAQRPAHQILMHGMVMILVGLAWGFVVPATPHPRLALGAHIQLESNGLLFIVLAVLLLTLPHRVAHRSLAVILLSVWLTWAMLLSEVANAWWGTTRMLPIAAAQAGATGGRPWQETVVQMTHVAAGLSLFVAWTLLIIGFARSPAETESAP
jgi:(hydroxyamino)benzene mutase